MWGTSEKQINRLFNETMNGIGKSRHFDKEIARKDGAISFRNMAKKTNIYSYGTADTYLPYWKNLADFAKKNKGIKDIEKISNRTVKEFLQSKIRDINCKSTFSKISSAILKMEESLNRYSQKNGSEKSYNWEKIVDNQREISKEKLNNSIEGRGFNNPKLVIDNLPLNNENHILAAKIQHESGVRINEVSLIKKKQLSGIGKDPYNEKDVGIVTVKGKGGKTREVYLTPETYKSLENNVKNDDFKIAKTSYTLAIKEAALSSNQVYTGTHDFRHKWVQDRYIELSKIGFSERQSMAAVSEEIGHVRPDITEVYLK